MHHKYPFPFKPLITLCLFAIGMAFLETAVVVYLRALYYPDGFAFPLKILPLRISLIEIAREAATIVMLATVGWFSGKKFLTRFAGFIIAFGVWDIFYYIFLKIILNWPAGLFDWDILFLIPLPWVGPVWAPVLVSISMIAAGCWIWLREAQQRPVLVKYYDWLLTALSGLIIIFSFLTEVKTVLNEMKPQFFHWEIFGIGLLIGIITFLNSLRRNVTNHGGEHKNSRKAAETQRN